MADRTILVDGDIFIYKAAFTSETVVQFDDDNWVSNADEGEARQTFDAMIYALAERLKSDRIVLCLSDPAANWRKALYPAYKQQRTKTRRPILLKPLREYAAGITSIGKLPVKVYARPTLEADDVLGILATHPTLVPGKKCICSIDKDLLQIPGWHHNVDKNETKKVEEYAGDIWHLTQTLVGDVVDNYPGCPGIGPKKAEVLLSNAYKEFPGDPAFDTRLAWGYVRTAFEKKGLTEADALVQARIARICRNTEYDFATKQVKPWSPPL
jgi:DNA polymerase-1